jgi:hypothetical protein
MRPKLSARRRRRVLVAFTVLLGVCHGDGSKSKSETPEDHIRALKLLEEKTNKELELLSSSACNEACIAHVTAETRATANELMMGEGGLERRFNIDGLKPVRDMNVKVGTASVHVGELPQM